MDMEKAGDIVIAFHVQMTCFDLCLAWVLDFNIKFDADITAALQLMSPSKHGKESA
jgi:hypothetical protein